MSVGLSMWPSKHRVKASGHRRIQDWQRVWPSTFFDNSGNKGSVNWLRSVDTSIPFPTVPAFKNSVSHFLPMKPLFFMGLSSLTQLERWGLMGFDRCHITLSSDWPLTHGWACDLSWSNRGEFPEVGQVITHWMRIKRQALEATI